MSIFPKTRDEWIALPLFPFKAWVVVAFPFYLAVHEYAAAQHVRYGTGGLGEAVIGGYMFSIIVLLLGALIQSIICSRGAATRTVLYAVASIILVLLFIGSSRPNQSPEPTAVLSAVALAEVDGACRSAIAVHAASRRWLSFFR
jgi:hypothetical protein